MGHGGRVCARPAVAGNRHRFMAEYEILVICTWTDSHCCLLAFLFFIHSRQVGRFSLRLSPFNSFKSLHVDNVYCVYCVYCVLALYVRFCFSCVVLVVGFFSILCVRYCIEILFILCDCFFGRSVFGWIIILALKYFWSRRRRTESASAHSAYSTAQPSVHLSSWNQQAAWRTVDSKSN